MCGIAGILDLKNEQVSANKIKKMCDVMHHRGPDDTGYYFNGNIGLGHKRLSIIDLSRGKQPVYNEDKSISIVFNGEIYNYLELITELKENGHIFYTSSDTEVIIHLYEEYDEKCVEYLNGMFSFAIWDSNREKLFLARDRLGVKPLYYAYKEEKIIFASEIKAILQSEYITAEPNYPAIMDYMTLTYVTGEKTFFKGINRLMPGHILVVENSRIEVKKYWDLELKPDYEHEEQYFIDKLEYLLRDSVKITLRSDVPLGCHLSGGLDSSTVCCLASSILNHPIKTFTGAFSEGPKYDETNYAKCVASYVNAEYFEIYPEVEDFGELLRKLTWYLDEPVVGPGVVPQYFVSKLVSENVKVVLGGQGGDEIFAGYLRHLQFSYEMEMLEHPCRSLFSITRFGGLKGLTLFSALFFLNGTSFEPRNRYFQIVSESFITKRELNKLFTEKFYKELGEYDCFESFCETLENIDRKNYKYIPFYCDIKNYLPGLLQVEDRTSMMNSVESRVPLLDHRIVEFSATIPQELKIKNYTLKYIFKETVKKWIPTEIYNRKDKKGFPTPTNEWFKKFNQEIRDILLDPVAVERGIYNTEYVEKILKNVKGSNGLHKKFIWKLLCVELWFKVFIDNKDYLEGKTTVETLLNNQSPLILTA